MDDLGKMLGSITGGGAGGAAGGGTGDIAGAIGGLVGGEGGLEGLIGKLNGAGLGDTVSSWVGTGPNKPVDPRALGDALGADGVNQLAGQSGLSVEALLPLLAAALPAVINALTPDGKVTHGNAAAGLDVGGMLKGLSEAAQGGPDSPLGQLGGLLGGGKG